MEKGTGSPSPSKAPQSDVDTQREVLETGWALRTGEGWWWGWSEDDASRVLKEARARRQATKNTWANHHTGGGFGRGAGKRKWNVSQWLWVGIKTVRERRPRYSHHVFACGVCRLVVVENAAVWRK